MSRNKKKKKRKSKCNLKKDLRSVKYKKRVETPKKVKLLKRAVIKPVTKKEIEYFIWPEDDA